MADLTDGAWLMKSVRTLEGKCEELEREIAHKNDTIGTLRVWLAQALDYQRGWRDGASHAPDYAKGYHEEIARLQHICAAQEAQIAAYEDDMRARAKVAAEEQRQKEGQQKPSAMDEALQRALAKHRL